MKPCIACVAVKPIDEFYAHRWMKDGHLNKCKDCCRTYSLAHRQANIEKVQEYDRARGLLPHRKEAVRLRAPKYKDRPKAPADPAKKKASQMVGNAIRDGRIKRKPCEKCSRTLGVQAHHEDYTKPFSITWLCTPCHGARHREINAERRAAAR